jgi:hypothetical protein
MILSSLFMYIRMLISTANSFFPHHSQAHHHQTKLHHKSHSLVFLSKFQVSQDPNMHFTRLLSALVALSFSILAAAAPVADANAAPMLPEGGSVSH